MAIIETYKGKINVSKSSDLYKFNTLVPGGDKSYTYLNKPPAFSMRDCHCSNAFLKLCNAYF